VGEKPNTGKQQTERTGRQHCNSKPNLESDSKTGSTVMMWYMKRQSRASALKSHDMKMYGGIEAKLHALTSQLD
jgi:hypothetical protein